MKNWKFAISNPLKDEEAPSRCKGRGGKLLLWREGTCLKRTMFGSSHRRCYMLRNNFNHVIVKRKTLRGSRWQTTQKRRLLLFFFPVVFRKMEHFARGRLGNGLAFCFISRRFWFSSHGNGDSLYSSRWIVFAIISICVWFSRLFGVPLTQLCTEEEPVPKAVQDLLLHLFRYGPSTTGIFRKSANARIAREIKIELDEGEKWSLSIN